MSGWIDISLTIQIVLYISDDSKVVGLILAKPITLAYRLQETNHESVSTDSQQSISLSYNQSDPVEAICGISRIWVHETHRRQKIATLMLDSLRKEFLYGVELTTSQIAFSQPTRMGQSLATAYFSRHDFLVYVD
ncbi:ESCO1/2 acetyl-transferase-domain-containing protein [Globomyces pollinis-pini]|nr:ESCO1/2 acetyl-transferase-domain-containing protein [Globomyces pollinis-pini]